MEPKLHADNCTTIKCSSMKTWKVIGGMMVVWLLVMVYMSSIMFQQPSENTSNLERQLRRVLREVDKLKAQNDEFRSLSDDIKLLQNPGSNSKRNKIIQNHVNDKDNGDDNEAEVKVKSHSFNDKGPTLEHEVTLRKTENDAVEFWYYMRSELAKAKSMTAGNTAVIQLLSKLHENGSAIHTKLLSDIYSLKNIDGMDDWRRQESENLGELVQKRIRHLQNPKDCAKAKKILCNLGKGCGYGCQLHHVTYCLIVAYANKRTLVLESKGWRYAPGGWETVFQPLSRTCTERGSGVHKNWAAYETIRNADIIELPIIDSIYPRPDYLPLAIPKDLSDRLIRLHGDPSVWWIGQFVKYLTRPQKTLQDNLEKAQQHLKFKTPIVGVHVRRTDKLIAEAKFHGIEEYMTYVVEYFKRLEDREGVKSKNVYLATDDTSVIEDARKKYPDYNFINDPDISKSAGLNSRYTDTSLYGVVADIHFLSLCDYLVCTFSSQVCRVAYEMMQTMHGDASQNFKSLDDIYYFGGQNAHDMTALEDHVPQGPQEIEMKKGDSIGIAGNHWDGYSKGMNRRTGKSGLFPSYKVKSKLVIVDLPSYPEVDKGS